MRLLIDWTKKRCVTMNIIKRIVCIPVAIVVSIVYMAMSASAHNADYHNGVYTGIFNQYNMKFRIESSAITSLLTPSVYYSGYNWSSISSNVGNIGIAIAVPGMPTTGFVLVRGENLSNGVFGETLPRDSSGNIVGMDANWYSVSINMNYNASAYSGMSNPTAFAKRTFMHEVGHCLKLAHPQFGYGITGHNIMGYPKAVMTSGLLSSSYPYVSANIEEHDKNNLKAKWGA